MEEQNQGEQSFVIENIERRVQTWTTTVKGLTPEKELEMRGKIALKLSKAYVAIESVIHDDKNQKHDYSFASAETIYRTCRKGMAEVGLAVVPLMGEFIEIPIYTRQPNGAEGDRRGAYVQVDFDFVLMDGETGYCIVIPWRGEVMEYGDKAFNKASTNATKYMLRTLFLLPTDKGEDTDSTDHNDRPSRNRGGQRGGGRDRSEPQQDQETHAGRGQGQGQAEVQTPQLTPEEAEKRRVAKEANDLIEKMGLKGDAMGLKDFSKIARSKEKEPLTAFLETAKANPTLKTWTELTLALTGAQTPDDELLAARVNDLKVLFGKERKKEAILGRMDALKIGADALIEQVVKESAADQVLSVQDLVAKLDELEAGAK